MAHLSKRKHLSLRSDYADCNDYVYVFRKKSANFRKNGKLLLHNLVLSCMLCVALVGLLVALPVQFQVIKSCLIVFVPKSTI